ncbi:MAG: hypothetical protein WCS55_01760 [Sulfuricurvum sp.]|uniref:hypothetical protein n=1 Tax=Sulfuricurvum sp. TaxID=2025608 RepID=UPI00356589BD
MKKFTLRSGKYNKKNNVAILRPRLFSVVNGIYKYFDHNLKNIKKTPIINRILGTVKAIFKAIKKCFNEIKRPFKNLKNEYVIIR